MAENTENPEKSPSEKKLEVDKITNSSLTDAEKRTAMVALMDEWQGQIASLTPEEKLDMANILKDTIHKDKNNLYTDRAVENMLIIAANTDNPEPILDNISLTLQSAQDDKQLSTILSSIGNNIHWGEAGQINFSENLENMLFWGINNPRAEEKTLNVLASMLSNNQISEQTREFLREDVASDYEKLKERKSLDPQFQDRIEGKFQRYDLNAKDQEAPQSQAQEKDPQSQAQEKEQAKLDEDFKKLLGPDYTPQNIAELTQNAETALTQKGTIKERNPAKLALLQLIIRKAEFDLKYGKDTQTMNNRRENIVANKDKINDAILETMERFAFSGKIGEKNYNDYKLIKNSFNMLHENAPEELKKHCGKTLELAYNKINTPGKSTSASRLQHAAAQKLKYQSMEIKDTDSLWTMAKKTAQLKSFNASRTAKKGIKRLWRHSLPFKMLQAEKRAWRARHHAVMRVQNRIALFPSRAKKAIGKFWKNKIAGPLKKKWQEKIAGPIKNAWNKRVVEPFNKKIVEPFKKNVVEPIRHGVEKSVQWVKDNKKKVIAGTIMVASIGIGAAVAGPAGAIAGAKLSGMAVAGATATYGAYKATKWTYNKGVELKDRVVANTKENLKSSFRKSQEKIPNIQNNQEKEKVKTEMSYTAGRQVFNKQPEAMKALLDSYKKSISSDGNEGKPLTEKEAAIKMYQTMVAEKSKGGMGLSQESAQSVMTYFKENNTIKSSFEDIKDEINKTVSETEKDTKQSDDTKQQQPDNTEQKQPDNTEQKQPDDTKQEQTDNTEQKQPDDTKQEQTDNTEQKQPDDTKQEQPDNTEQKQPDDTEQKQPDDTKQEQPDDTKQEQPDNTEINTQQRLDELYQATQEGALNHGFKNMQLMSSLMNGDTDNDKAVMDTIKKTIKDVPADGVSSVIAGIEHIKNKELQKELLSTALERTDLDCRALGAIGQVCSNIANDNKNNDNRDLMPILEDANSRLAEKAKQNKGFFSKKDPDFKDNGAYAQDNVASAMSQIANDGKQFDERKKDPKNMSPEDKKQIIDLSIKGTNPHLTSKKKKRDRGNKNRHRFQENWKTKNNHNNVNIPSGRDLR